jgi:16S rRNA (guanine966-N2)-methyltransferase
MRVIAGSLKGRPLVAPRGHRTRPTADQVRIALLDALGPWLSGARLLDLFAGSGSIGFEALSRGAAQATFVERDAQAIVALRRNVDALGVRGRARVMRGEVARELRRLADAGERFDVVFLDPPYEGDLVRVTLGHLGDGLATGPGALVVAQHFTKQPPPEAIGCLAMFRTRRFGETTLSFFRHAPAEERSSQPEDTGEARPDPSPDTP